MKNDKLKNQSKERGRTLWKTVCCGANYRRENTATESTATYMAGLTGVAAVKRVILGDVEYNYYSGSEVVHNLTA